ncbi:MAG: hypothetical protein M5R40_27425 [Anaerolineae bacterium]|nr:hypothetical protein [Anaerolineae bacterium]
MAGDNNLIRRLIDGAWDHDFLVVPPGEEIAQQMNGDIVDSQPYQE